MYLLVRRKLVRHSFLMTADATKAEMVETNVLNLKREIEEWEA